MADYKSPTTCCRSWIGTAISSLQYFAGFSAFSCENDALMTRNALYVVIIIIIIIIIHVIISLAIRQCAA